MHSALWIFKRVAGLAILAIVLLIIALWLERRSPTTLPTPTGPFAVGRTTYDWTDNAASTKRELFVWMWYPAALQTAAVMDDYLPGDWRAAIASARGPLIGLLTRDLSKVHCHSLRNATLSTQQASYPVVILRAGASSEVTNYTTLAEDLASHGYVVVGFDAPYRTFEVVFPDGRVMKRVPQNNPELCEGRPDQEPCAKGILAAWTSDTGFVLDRLALLNTSDPAGKFTGRLDLTRVGMFGHSFGGAAAALFCQEDPRCKAGIDIDGAPHGSVIQAGLNRPFLFLMSDHTHESDPEATRIMANIQSIYDRLPPQDRLRLMIRGSNHFMFSDDGALLKSHIVLGALRLFGILGMDGRRQLAVTAYCIHSFFDQHLKGPGVSGLKLPSPLYPEIQVLP